MTPNVRGQHAYFPALITCIAFVDLLSGLYAGNLQHHSRSELERYAEKFMKPEYTTDRVRVLYEFLRHKIAHLAYPYPVFDTVTKQHAFKGQPRRRITWTVYASKRRPALRSASLVSKSILSNRFMDRRDIFDTFYQIRPPKSTLQHACGSIIRDEIPSWPSRMCADRRNFYKVEKWSKDSQWIEENVVRLARTASMQKRQAHADKADD
jgi:hypothetical protein